MGQEKESRARGWRHWNWFLLLPKLGVVLFLLAVSGLLAVLHYNEREDQRTQLIGDLLWVEQNIRFHLVGNHDLLQQLGEDVLTTATADKTKLALRAKSVLKNNPELARLQWFDANGNILESIPPLERPLPQTGLSARAQAREMGRFSGKPTYSRAFEADGQSLFEVHVPAFRGDLFAGEIIGIYSVRNILDHLVPWWFAQKYQLQIIDEDGRPLGSKSQLTSEASLVEYRVALDLPGGLLLKASAYRSETSLARNLLILFIFFLAAITLWSLFALRSHFRQRQMAEDALKSEHAFRKAMEDSLRTGMRALGLDGTIIYVNPAFCQMMGFTPAELVGHAAPQPYWPPEERGRITEAFAALRSDVKQAAAGVEMRLMRKNGERIDVLVYEAPLINADGQQTGWMGSVLDITERKKARELLRQQEDRLQTTVRLVSMGEMASSLAHEINQPLAAIASYNTGCINMLERGDCPPDELLEVLRKVGSQAQRAGVIIRRVYDFVRRSEPKQAPANVNRVIQESLAFLAHDIRQKRIELITTLDSGIPELQIDEVLIGQVVFNLVRNAMESMQETIMESRILCVGSVLEQNSVRIAVADRGCGVSGDNYEQIFSPFFTTKTQGMGMGLNICRSVIEAHHGRLWAEPNPEGGSIFIFTLPCPAKTP